MASMRVRTLALGAALLLTVTACGGGNDDVESGSAPAGAEGAAPASEGSAEGDAQGSAGSGEDAAPAFVATTLDGDELDSASLAGTDTVLWFWAPWCTTCRAEAPDVAATAAAFADEVKVVGVASRGDVGEMEDFVSDTDTGAFAHVADEAGDIWSSYGVAAQPAFAFINDDGTYTVHLGALGADGLQERFEQLAAA
jgi:thiol-disulfide isomerase/thioredoxin